MKVLNVFTDGAYRDRSQIGAYAYLIVNNKGKVLKKYSRAVKKDLEKARTAYLTNNVMELQAVLKALNWVKSNGYNPKEHRVYVYTDSQYVQLGVTEWLDSWKRNGWKNSANKPIKNKEYWVVLEKLVKFDFDSIHIQWIQGHDWNKYNKEVDKLCTQAINNYEQQYPNDDG